LTLLNIRRTTTEKLMLTNLELIEVSK